MLVAPLSPQNLTTFDLRVGVSGEKASSILRFDLKSKKWSSIEPKGDVPKHRCYHSGIVVGKEIWIYGGKATNFHLNTS